MHNFNTLKFRLSIMAALVLIMGLSSWVIVGAARADSRTTANEHCVAHLSPVDPRSSDSSEISNVRCYETFAEAVNASIGTPSEETSSGQEERSSSHCVAYLSPIVPGDGKDSDVTLIGCYDSFSEAINIATEGTVTLAEGIKPSQVTDELLNSLAMGSNFTPVITGIDYDGAYFVDSSEEPGDTFTWTAEQGCSSTIGYIANAMPTGWDNRVGSARSYSGCNKNGHYANTNRGGSSITCNPGITCETMGILDNSTSSEDWFN
jgi:hypothetical protein